MIIDQKIYCVIDIGATNFRCGLYSEGKLLNTIERKLTPNYYMFDDEERLKTEIVNMILDSFIKVSKYQDVRVSCLAICFPGQVNGNGDIIGSSGIFGNSLKKVFLLKKELQEKIDKRIHIVITNDMTASAWRYSDEYESFCLITVSSGIGNKIFSYGRVLVGENGLCGEIGHYSVDLSDLSIPCNCGWGKNHIDIISSSRGIEIVAKYFAQVNGKYRGSFLTSELAKDISGDEKRITPELIAQFAQKKDIFAQTVIDYCTKPLADAICLLALAIYIEKFIIIGGFALNCKYYMDSLKNNILRRGIYNFKKEDIENMIIYGENDDNHALIGLGKMIDNLQ